MSAFMVSREHINALVSLAARGGHDRLTWTTPAFDKIAAQRPAGGTFDELAPYFAALDAERRTIKPGDTDAADRIGRILALENAASVLYRYPDHDNSEYVPAWTTDGSFVWELGRATPDALQGLKIIACYEYQSCEHPGWGTSEAKRFCDALRLHLIPQLKGYDEAPWEWDAEAVAR